MFGMVVVDGVVAVVVVVVGFQCYCYYYYYCYYCYYYCCCCLCCCCCWFALRKYATKKCATKPDDVGFETADCYCVSNGEALLIT